MSNIFKGNIGPCFGDHTNKPKKDRAALLALDKACSDRTCWSAPQPITGDFFYVSSNRWDSKSGVP